MELTMKNHGIFGKTEASGTSPLSQRIGNRHNLADLLAPLTRSRPYLIAKRSVSVADYGFPQRCR